MPTCPECKTGKHGKLCAGWAWDDVADKPADCDCDCQED